jgi:hypothetical protein
MVAGQQTVRLCQLPADSLAPQAPVAPAPLGALLRASALAPLQSHRSIHLGELAMGNWPRAGVLPPAKPLADQHRASAKPPPDPERSPVERDWQAGPGRFEPRWPQAAQAPETPGTTSNRSAEPPSRGTVQPPPSLPPAASFRLPPPSPAGNHLPRTADSAYSQKTTSGKQPKPRR